MDYQELQAYQRDLLSQALAEGVKRNEEQIKTWVNYRDAHRKVIKGLEILPQELSINCMVPLGKRALMRGKLAHTNEIMVCLGDGYFAKYSARQAVGVCERRIQQAEEMISNLEKERNLLEMRQTIPLDNDAFGDEGRREIIEPYDAAKEKEWKIQHRQREKEYRQKLAQLRTQEKIEIETEDDLWHRLDELELQEELEENIDRLRDDDCNYYGDELKEGEAYYESEDYESTDDDEMTNEMLERELEKLKQNQLSNDKRDELSEKNVNIKHDSGRIQSSSSSDTTVNGIESANRKYEDNDSLKVLLSGTNSINIGSVENIDITKEPIKFFENEIDSSQNSVQTLINAEPQSTDSIPSKSSDSDDKSCRGIFFEKPQDNGYLLGDEDPLRGLLDKNGFTSSASNVFEEEKQKCNNRRKVSFVEPSSTPGAVTGYLNDSNDDVPNSKSTERRDSCIQQTGSVDQTPKVSTEESNDDDDDEIVRIDFEHTKNNPSIPVGNGEAIENPRDFYRVFCKPKSILKRSPGDANYCHKITPPADDSTDEEFAETEPAGSTYTMVVKDIQERKPDAQKVHELTSDTRPISRFKMARSRVKE